MGDAQWRSLRLALVAGSQIRRLLHRADSPTSHLDPLVSAPCRPAALWSAALTRRTLRCGATLGLRLSYRTKTRSCCGSARNFRTARTGRLSSWHLLTSCLPEGRGGVGGTSAVGESLSLRGRYYAPYAGSQTVSLPGC